MATPDSRYREGSTYKSALIVSLSLFLIGLAILVWMSIAFTGELSATQETLRHSSDWLIKSSMGLIVGLISGRSMS